MFPLYTIPLVVWYGKLHPKVLCFLSDGTCSTKVVSQEQAGCGGTDLEARRFRCHWIDAWEVDCGSLPSHPKLS
jgi:hypothetical protein